MEKQHLWMAITPYGKLSEYIAEYADAIAIDDQLQLQVAVFTLPFYLDYPLQPTLNPKDAYREVDDGKSIYFVGVPFGNCEGCWVNPEGQVEKEQSIIISDSVVATIIGKTYNQQCILRVSEQQGEDGYLYLLQDTPANRGIAVSIAGGYTAGDGYLLVATKDLLPSEALEGDWDYIPVGISLMYL